MLVRCNSDVPISLACSAEPASDQTTTSSEPRAGETSNTCGQADKGCKLTVSCLLTDRRLRQKDGVVTPQPVKDKREAARQRDHRALSTAAASDLLGRGSQPCRGTRFSMTVVAAWHNARRSLASSAFVITPESSRSPNRLRDGVKPTHGPTFFEDQNRARLPAAEQNVDATTAPIPGTDARGGHTSSSRASPRTCHSSSASSWRRAPGARSVGSLAVSSIAFPVANAHSRPCRACPPRPRAGASVVPDHAGAGMGGAAVRRIDGPGRDAERKQRDRWQRNDPPFDSS